MNEFPAGDTVAAEGSPRRVALVTGMSGAGMSSALGVLEDLGYEAVDNLPLSLVPALLAQDDLSSRPIAVGIDCRTRGFTADRLLSELGELKSDAALSVGLLFLDCDDEVLQRRYTETRRRHPLAVDRPVADGIAADRNVVGPLRDQADLLIDSTALSIHDLRRQLEGHFAVGGAPGPFVQVTSFSFSRGLPRESDLVFDVRFLDNPYWNPDLRPLTGLDEAVQQAVAADRDFAEFFDRMTGLLSPLLPRYNHEGKSYLTIAIGCTGGRHRSVFVATRLGRWLEDQGYRVGLMHRDLPATS